MASKITTTAQLLSISISLVASGGIATLSLFDVPELQSQPASRSLPSTRWLFSRGSHIFPGAAFLSSAGFAFLAYNALPAGPARSIAQLLKIAANSGKVNGYLAAAALTLGIGPWTSIVMIPTNFALIQKNEDLGGARSEKSAKEGGEKHGSRSAEDSVDGQGQADQFTDLSGPQSSTDKKSSREQDEEVRALLGKFGALNAVRAVMMGAGGMVGLWAALL